MTSEEALTVLDRLLEQKRVTHLQETVFCRAWDGQTYEQIAATEDYDPDYVKLVGSQLWQLVSERVGQRVTKNNFRVVLRQWAKGEATPDVLSYSRSRQQDWGEAIDLSGFCGRSQELSQLEQWITSEHCRLVALLGMGGIGKTVLSAKLAERLQGKFEYLIWRSLRNAPPIDTVLSDLIQFLSHQQETELPESVDGKLGQLMHYLRQQRCLVILDNVESILGTREQAGHYPIGYESYGELFRRIGETLHQSCVVITSREKPREVAALEGTSIRSLKLTGLNRSQVRELLKTKKLSATETGFEQLTNLYAGNALALKIAATTIQELFDGSVAEFLQQGTAVFGDISELLGQQFDRLSDLEKQIMYWLAIDREGASLSELAEDLVPAVPKRYLMEALASLARRPLIEKQGTRFTQQPVVMEYVTNRLIEQVFAEIAQARKKAESDSEPSSLNASTGLSLFQSHALVKATVEDHVRESQVRMIVQPLLDRLCATIHPKSEVQRQLQQIVITLQNQLDGTSGYGAGNVINLLKQLGADLTNSDFSGLAVWQACLQGVNLRQVNFANSDLSKSVFSETLGNVWSVAFNPDGNLLAASDTAGEIHVWQMSHAEVGLPDASETVHRANRQKLMTFQGHQHWVCTIAFSPDGQLLASGSGDNTVKLWNVKTGACLRTLKDHTDWVISVAFSPINTFPEEVIVASSSSDCTIRLWNAHTGRCLRILAGHQHWVCAIAFSPDGRLLVSASDDRTLKVWDVQTGQCLRTLEGHTSLIRGVAFSPKGQTAASELDEALIASGSGDQTVKVWSVATGRCVKTFVGHTSEVRCVVFHPDGNLLASSSLDHTIKLWDLNTGQCLKTLKGHTDAVRSLCFANFKAGDLSTSRQILASGSADQSVRLWNQAGDCIRTLQGYTNFVLSVAFSPDRQTLASSSANYTVKLWDLASGQCLKTLHGHTNWVWSVAFSPDGQTLASGSFDQTIRLWHRQTGQCQVLRGHTNWVWSVAFSPIGQLLASGSSDQTIRLWHPQTGQCLKVLVTPSRVWAVAFSADGQLLASGGEDHSIQIWDLGKDQCLRTLKGHQGRICSVAFSRDRQLIISSSDDHTIKLWDVKTGDCLQTLRDRDCVKSAGFIMDGAKIVSAGADHTVKVWDVKTGQCQQVLQGHQKRVWSVACADQSNLQSPKVLIASGSEDETIRLWDETGLCARILQNPHPYEGMNITGATGLTTAQKATLKALGAVDLA